MKLSSYLISLYKLIQALIQVNIYVNYCLFYHYSNLRYLTETIYRSMEDFDQTISPTASPYLFIVSKQSPSHGKPAGQSKFCQTNAITLEEDLLLECRICLEGTQAGAMIKPCECKGSIEYAHQKCLKEWIKRLLQSQSQVKCQFCKTAYNFDHSEQKEINCDEFLSNWQHKRKRISCFLIIYILGIFSLLAFIGFIAAINPSENDLKNKVIPDKNILIIYIVVMVVSCILMLILISIFIGEYCMRREITIKVRRYNGEEKKLKLERKKKLYRFWSLQ